MRAILGGSCRAPFTGIVFAFELTYDVNMLLPLVVAVTAAHAFTVLTLRRSILTEKISRRGYHLTREYEADPLEILFVREVVRTNVVALPATATAAEARQVTAASSRERRRQHLFPVVGSEQRLVGVVTRDGLERWLADARDGSPLLDAVSGSGVVAYADEPLRVVAQRMAETGLTRFPVVERGDGRRLVGMVSLSDLLKGRRQALDAEQRRERVLTLRVATPWRRAVDGAASSR
jgi:CBS domain-containing protein